MYYDQVACIFQVFEIKIKVVPNFIPHAQKFIKQKQNKLNSNISKVFKQQLNFSIYFVIVVSLINNYLKKKIAVAKRFKYFHTIIFE